MNRQFDIIQQNSAVMPKRDGSSKKCVVPVTKVWLEAMPLRYGFIHASSVDFLKPLQKVDTIDLVGTLIEDAEGEAIIICGIDVTTRVKDLGWGFR